MRVLLFGASAAWTLLLRHSGGGKTGRRCWPGLASVESDTVESDTVDESDNVVSSLAGELAAAKAKFRGSPMLIAGGLSEPPPLAADKACAMEFELGPDGWAAFLVKVEGGVPQACGTVEVAGQLWNYARSLRREGVETLLEVGADLERGDAESEKRERWLAPDVTMAGRDDRRPRFAFDLAHTSFSATRQAERVAELFSGFGRSLRNVVTLKIQDRHSNDRFPALAVHYRRDDHDHRVHVVRAFQVGTTTFDDDLDDDDLDDEDIATTSMTTATLKRLVREAWDANDFVLDAGVDDGTTDGFNLEACDSLQEVRLPPTCLDDGGLAESMQVTIPHTDFFYDFDAYEPPKKKPPPFVLELYEVMFVLDGALRRAA